MRNINSIRSKNITYTQDCHITSSVWRMSTGPLTLEKYSQSESIMNGPATTAQATKAHLIASMWQRFFFFLSYFSLCPHKRTHLDRLPCTTSKNWPSYVSLCSFEAFQSNMPCTHVGHDGNLDITFPWHMSWTMPICLV